MLPEPELSMVCDYLMRGGEIKEIPFGISGFSWSFGDTARKSGSWGTFRRYGGMYIETEAFSHIAAGQLSPAQARVGLIWSRLRERGPLTVNELADEFRISPRTVRATVMALVETGAVRPLITAGRGKFAAAERGRAPHWTDYLPPQAAAA